MEFQHQSPDRAEGLRLKVSTNSHLGQMPERLINIKANTDHQAFPAPVTKSWLLLLCILGIHSSAMYTFVYTDPYPYPLQPLSIDTFPPASLFSYRTQPFCLCVILVLGSSLGSWFFSLLFLSCFPSLSHTAQSILLAMFSPDFRMPLAGHFLSPIKLSWISPSCVKKPLYQPKGQEFMEFLKGILYYKSAYKEN